MKKIVKLLSLIFVAAFALVLAGCKIEVLPEVDVDYTFGMGVVTNDYDSAVGNAQNNSLVAAVVMADGKIVACKVDAAQNVATLNADGTYTVNETKLNNSKKELKEKYNMATYGAALDNNGDGVVKEWYQQAEAFESWCVGKTAAEVAALKTKAATTGSVGYMIADDADLLAAGCTIQIADFRDAVVKACADEQGKTFTLTEDTQFVLAVAVTSTLDSSSTAATAEATGAVNMYSDFAAVVMVDNKIEAALIDAVQPKIAYDLATLTPVMTFSGTKRELKENYNMSKWGTPNYNPENDSTKKATEWYQQAQAFTNYIVGMTGEQVAAIETQVMPEGSANAGYVIAKDETLLAAGCTIQITAIKANVAKACSYAK